MDFFARRTRAMTWGHETIRHLVPLVFRHARFDVVGAAWEATDCGGERALNGNPATRDYVTSHLLHVVGDVTVNRLGQVHIAYFISEMSILNVSRLIWYSKEGPGLAAAPPNSLLAVRNVTNHPSTASVPTSYYSMWHYNYLYTIKG